MVSLSARSCHRRLQATETDLPADKMQKEAAVPLRTAVFDVLVFEKEEVRTSCYQDELDDHEDRY